MNEYMSEKSWFQKYKLPLLLAFIALCFYFAGMLSIITHGS